MSALGITGISTKCT